MKKRLIIVLTSIGVVGCTAASTLDDNQKASIGVLGAAIEGCYQKGYINNNDYGMAKNAYSVILRDSKKDLPIIQTAFNQAIHNIESLSYNDCHTYVPQTLVNMYKYYEHHRLTVGDVLVGISSLSNQYQDHANQMYQMAQNTSYMPHLDMPRPKQSKNITSFQSGNTTFYSDGTSSTRIGNQVFHSNGVNSTIVGDTAYHSDGTHSSRTGDWIYNSDGTKCYKSGSMLTCK